MVKIKETDYHHGALTAVLVNNGYNLILWETHESRRSYKVTQGKSEFIIYSKYASKPSSKNGDKSSTWSYSFTDDEIDKVKGYMEDFENSKVALISGNGNTKGGELVILGKEDFLNCIGDGWKSENPYISVLKEKFCQLRVYGRGISREQAFIPVMEIITSL